jgi:hypothetical protein
MPLQTPLGPTWESVELDRGKPCVWAGRRCLFAGALDRVAGFGSPKLLRDFDDMQFEASAAPY